MATCGKKRNMPAFNNYLLSVGTSSSSITSTEIINESEPSFSLHVSSLLSQSPDQLGITSLMRRMRVETHCPTCDANQVLFRF